MKVLKWILLVAATAVSVAAVVYAVLNRAELCCERVTCLADKVKGFVTSHVERFFSEEDFADDNEEIEIKLQ